MKNASRALWTCRGVADAASFLGEAAAGRELTRLRWRFPISTMHSFIYILHPLPTSDSLRSSPRTATETISRPWFST